MAPPPPDAASAAATLPVGTAQVGTAPVTAVKDTGRAALRVFVNDDESEAAIHAGLVNAMSTGIVMERGDVRTATRALANSPTPYVLVVDVSGVENAVAALGDLAAVCTPDVRVLVVGDRPEISFYRRLVHELGVGEYIYKPLTRNNVTALFGPFLAPAGDKPAALRGGHVVAVCGVRGGVGATTIAINLALQLEATKRHIALLDLHLRGGTTAMMLGVRPSSGLRMALEQPDRIDALFVDRMAIEIQGRLRLLAAEEPFGELPAPRPEGAARLLELLRQRFSYIVVDLPTPPSDWGREVLAVARDCILVLGPDLAGIRDCEAMCKLVATLSGSSHAIVVLNRAGAPGALKLPLITEGLGRSPDVVIPDLPHHLPLAANLGQPTLSGNAALRKAMAPLIQQIFGLETAPGKARSPLMRLLRGR